MKVVHRLLLVAVAWWLRQGGAPTVARHCAHACRGVSIPYPFGLEPQCASSKEFLLNCSTTNRGQQLLLHNISIHKISVPDSTMVVRIPEVYACYDENGHPTNRSDHLDITLPNTPQYRFSNTRNSLTVLGCNTSALISDKDGKFHTGCISYCSNYVDFASCQASIPKGLDKLRIRISSIDNPTLVCPFNHCGQAFVGNISSLNISNWRLPNLKDLGKRADFVLDWMIRWDVTCEQAKSNQSSYACGNNTHCDDFENGYRCLCNPGYEGNPYDRLHGCQDINECEDPQTYHCCGKCQNQPGNYKCDDPISRDDRRAIAVAAILVPVLCISVGAIVLVTCKWRIKRINFRRNGGKLMKRHGVRIFTEAELAKATNNYDESNKLGEGGFSSVYKGSIAGHIEIEVAVKKPKDVHKSLIKKDFQHELKTVAQINHQNVVKLHGICLETRIPLLVYEYISNGTLFQHIHPNLSTILRPWKNRLKIATEAALALMCLHSSAIIHGNIKSANILLDQNYSVKVSDSGTSVLISPEHSHIVATKIKGTLGYIDPEYLITGMLTTQSDVYSFGVVLVELLTGKKLFVTKSRVSINIIHRFISSVKDDTLPDVVNFEGASEEEMERVRMVAEIAVKCLDQSGVNRPAMSDVAQQLANISPSSTVEENIEDISDGVAETPSSLDEETSSCLSCLGMDSACSCI